ncbi:MAG: multidrug transporter [Verrucomicrobia bacterium]|nr:MAG: multidrug transporter [Verrucomicrobiota bacterium]
MEVEQPDTASKTIRTLRIAIISAAIALGLIVVFQTNRQPRTDDAEVLANFIGIAPQVEGPIVRLNVRDNQFVKKGELLFEIDDRPYRYALERAQSEQAALEGQIADERRTIAAQQSAVLVAEANSKSAEADILRSQAAVEGAKADVATAAQGVNRAAAEWTYANNNLHRIEPLLARQFVTVDQVDQAKTLEVAKAEALKQTRSEWEASKAALASTLAQLDRAKAVVEQSKAQIAQAQHAVTTLEPLTTQRGARLSAIQTAQYDLDNCKVYSPFDAVVTNLTISEGMYAHKGAEIFTLIDTRTWWAVGNFRETQLKQIKPGMRADVYVLSRPTELFTAVVDSVAFGVTPDPDVFGRLSPGLPDVQRSLNWVRLASRYPVRVRVKDPPADLFRISESAVVVIRGY